MAAHRRLASSTSSSETRDEPRPVTSTPLTFNHDKTRVTQQGHANALYWLLSTSFAALGAFRHHVPSLSVVASSGVSRVDTVFPTTLFPPPAYALVGALSPPLVAPTVTTASPPPIVAPVVTPLVTTLSPPAVVPFVSSLSPPLAAPLLTSLSPPSSTPDLNPLSTPESSPLSSPLSTPLSVRWESTVAIIGVAVASVSVILLFLWMCCNFECFFFRRRSAKIDDAFASQKKNGSGGSDGLGGHGRKEGRKGARGGELDDVAPFSDVPLGTPAAAPPDTPFWGVGGQAGGRFSWLAPAAKHLASPTSGTPRSPHSPPGAPGGLESMPVHMYSFRELQRATRSFSIELESSSPHGTLYKAIFGNGMEAAVKILSSTSSASSPRATGPASAKSPNQAFQNEAAALGRLHHPHVALLLGYCIERGHKMLVYEYLPNGTLESCLHDDIRLPLWWSERVRIIREIAMGLAYLHEETMPPVIHRELTSATILLDANFSVRLTDFGYTKHDSPGVLRGRGKIVGYLDPEYLTTNIYTEKSDIYSFGILVFEIITGRTPAMGLVEFVGEATQVEAEGGADKWAILLDPRLEGNYDKDELAEFVAIGFKCLRKAPARRPKMSEVVECLSSIKPSPSPRSLNQTSSLSSTSYGGSSRPGLSPSESFRSDFSSALSPTAGSPAPGNSARPNSRNLHGLPSFAEYQRANPPPSSQFEQALPVVNSRSSRFGNTQFASSHPESSSFGGGRLATVPLASTGGSVGASGQRAATQSQPSDYAPMASSDTRTSKKGKDKTARDHSVR
eukprot:TRINITY_DN33271_c0_g1_i1.p1 TRINITY_DN33271_c0_g1~~TRINITY_DN33271_c0_g1_i1.p1  ORF type:complete len:791 (-),score=97.13 TRINITY_DN33271_c0_g1_i1:173-2545(-)